MQPKVKITFSLIVLIIGLTFSSAFYIQHKILSDAKRYGIKENAIVVKKYDEKTIITESKYVTGGRGRRPFPKSQYFKYYINVKYPIDRNVKYLYQTEAFEPFGKDIHSLYLSKYGFDNLSTGDSVQIIHYSKNDNEQLFYAKDVEQLPLLIEYYYLFAVVGLFLSILLYRKL